MKIHLPQILLLIFLFFCVGSNAQDKFSGRDFAGIKNDFNQVGIVARVKIKDIQLAASDTDSLYKVESKIIESFKGSVKTGQEFTFYFYAEEGYNVKPLLGGEWIVFLDKESPAPPKGKEKGWYELENSKLPASKALNKKLRRLKRA